MLFDMRRACKTNLSSGQAGLYAYRNAGEAGESSPRGSMYWGSRFSRINVACALERLFQLNPFRLWT